MAVLGAGAAGLMCAIAAGQRGRRVVVLERNDRIGEKIRISGGGRCNFTNLATPPERFLCGNPSFHVSALARYPPSAFIALVERHGIRWHEKAEGQLFCDGSSREIIAMLRAECAAAGVEIVTACEVGEVDRGPGTRDLRGDAPRPDADARFLVRTSNGDFAVSSLVVATGGLSIPKLGATDLGYRIARQFGHRIVEPRPGLVPLLLDGEDLAFASILTGVSLEAVVSCDSGARPETGGRDGSGARPEAGGRGRPASRLAESASFRGSILFTHRGLSGPAILQLSSYWTRGSPIVLDLCPDLDVAAHLAGRRAGAGGGLVAALSEILPRRLAGAWCERHGYSDSLSNASNDTLGRIARGLRRWEVTPSGTEGFSKAEVTCGGVETGGLSSRTMESRIVPGLYFIGEVVDVTGHLGGFNFQWAWASGAAAGSSV